MALPTSGGDDRYLWWKTSIRFSLLARHPMHSLVNSWQSTFADLSYRPVFRCVDFLRLLSRGSWPVFHCPITLLMVLGSFLGKTLELSLPYIVYNLDTAADWRICSTIGTSHSCDMIMSGVTGKFCFPFLLWICKKCEVLDGEFAMCLLNRYVILSGRTC